MKRREFFAKAVGLLGGAAVAGVVLPAVVKAAPPAYLIDNDAWYIPEEDNGEYAWQVVEHIGNGRVKARLMPPGWKP